MQKHLAQPSASQSSTVRKRCQNSTEKERRWKCWCSQCYLVTSLPGNGSPIIFEARDKMDSCSSWKSPDQGLNRIWSILDINARVKLWPPRLSHRCVYWMKPANLCPLAEPWLKYSDCTCSPWKKEMEGANEWSQYGTRHTRHETVTPVTCWQFTETKLRVRLWALKGWLDRLDNGHLISRYTLLFPPDQM